MVGPFSALKSWRDRRRILRDIRRHAADAREVDRFKVKDQLTYAHAALDNNDLRQAAEIWDRLVADHRSAALDSPLALRVLVGLRRYEEATMVMRQGQQRVPGEPRFLQGLGQIAQAKGDHEEAIQLFAQLRKRFPGIMEGYTSAVESLKKTNRLTEAEPLVMKAMRNFQSHIVPFLEYARIAVLREDWEEALRRWQRVQDQFDHVVGFVGAAQALARLGRYEAAEHLLQQARVRFGVDPAPLSELARVAEAKGEAAEARRRWKDVVHLFPLDRGAQLIAAEAFERIGESAEAEATLRAAIDRFPNELRPMLDLAKLLQIKRRDFAAAAEVWATIRVAFPNFEEAYTSGAQALRQTGCAEAADTLLSSYRSRCNKA